MRFQGILRAVARLRKVADHPRFRRWVFPVAGLVFLAITFFSFKALPEGQRITRAYLLPLLVIVGAPINVFVLAAEFKVMASTIGQRVPVGRAVRVTLAASLANYLPAPGGVAVRTVAMRKQGSTVGTALKANAVVGMAWLGMAGAAAGVAFLAGGDRLGEGGAFLAGGLAVLAGSGVLLHRSNRASSDPIQTYRSFQKLVLVEILMVANATARIWIALAVVGELAPIGTAVGLSTSGVVAAAVGIFPAGLGIREIIAGAMGGLLGVPVAVAVAATAIDRVTRQLGTALFAIATGIRRSDLGGSGPGDDDDDDEPGSQGPSGVGGDDEAEPSGEDGERAAEMATAPTPTELERST